VSATDGIFAGQGYVRSMGRPGADRDSPTDSPTDSATDSPTDSATDSAKEFLYHPLPLSKSIIGRF